MIDAMSCRRAGLLGLALMLAACASTAPPTVAPVAAPVAAPVPQEPDVFEKLARADQASNPLAKLLAIQALQDESGNEPQETLDLLHQSVAWAAAEVGDYAGAHSAFDLVGRGGAPLQPVPTAPEDHAPVDAVEAIVQAAGTAQVVMINEAHHVPQHRAFTLELLETLRQQGFTYFAAEALHPDQDPDLATRGYPTVNTGPYIQEPVFGELIRTAIRLGYRIVRYEASYKRGQTWQDRERGQAANLIERILRDDPQARVLVHLGYSHNDERAGEKQWMAAHFHKETGIDPLTVNQFRMTERSAPELEEPIYRWAIERGALVDRPVVFRKDGAFWSAGDGNDVTVFHPRSRLENGRPTWLRMNGRRTIHPLPEDICGTAPRCLVQARIAGEGKDAIPIDQIVVDAGKPVPALLLPPGEMVIRVEDAEGKLIQERPLQARS